MMVEVWEREGDLVKEDYGVYKEKLWGWERVHRFPLSRFCTIISSFGEGVVIIFCLKIGLAWVLYI